MNVLSLFSGIGGLDLGLERAGMTICGQVEIDPWCRKVLAKHWPEVPRHDDVRTCVQWWGGRRVPDLVAAGIPCQPASVAGKRRGQDDERWLWPETAGAIGALRPGWLIIENVPGLRNRGLADILSDLTGLGYRTRPGYISACAVGAPHPRQRLFTLAHSDSTRCRPWSGVGPARSSPIGASWWSAEPSMDRVAYGVPRGVDRRRALGNAVVPQVAEHIGRLIMEAAS